MINLIGVSAILSYNNKYIFEIQKPHKWNCESSNIEIGIGCIGGSVECNETPEETLQRESMEEIQTKVKIQKWNKPFEIKDDLLVYDISEKEIDNVFFYWQGKGTQNRGNKVCVFLGEVLQKPWPGDLPGILITDIDLLVECFQEKLTLGEAIKKGVELIYKEEIPLEAKIKPVGTVKMVEELYLKHKEKLKHLLKR